MKWLESCALGLALCVGLGGVMAAQAWRDNRSEGASFYFLDPDGHRLEAHVGDLASRLRACREHPYAGMRFYPSD